ncbi:hypothetical protein N7486_002472 [Penicillium sp. IBT 16267x]|nr:hypothetical protein N7486_002472 [Penicillium sp. IBT 16267x]
MLPPTTEKTCATCILATYWPELDIWYVNAGKERRHTAQVKFGHGKRGPIGITERISEKPLGHRANVAVSITIKCAKWRQVLLPSHGKRADRLQYPVLGVCHPGEQILQPDGKHNKRPFGKWRHGNLTVNRRGRLSYVLHATDGLIIELMWPVFTQKSDATEEGICRMWRGRMPTTHIARKIHLVIAERNASCSVGEIEATANAAICIDGVNVNVPHCSHCLECGVHIIMTKPGPQPPLQLAERSGSKGSAAE